MDAVRGRNEGDGASCATGLAAPRVPPPTALRLIVVARASTDHRLSAYLAAVRAIEKAGGEVDGQVERADVVAHDIGNMVGYGREYLTRAPWIMLAPAATIVVTTPAVSVIGDWLRDRLDPTLRNR